MELEAVLYLIDIIYPRVNRSNDLLLIFAVSS